MAFKSFTYFRRHSTRVLLGLVLTGAMLSHVLGLFPIAFLDQLEALSYDARVRLTAPGTVDPRIVIVDIDEKSLEAEGRWPWGRDKVGRLLDKLFDEQQVAVVGFDVVFAEPDDSSGLNTLRELAKGPLKGNAEYQSVLRQVAPALDRDAQLVDAIAGRNVVLGYYFTTGRRNNVAHISGTLPDPTFSFIEFVDRDIPFLVAEGYGANLEDLQAVAHSAGHFNPLYDIDGVSRRVPMLMEYEGDYYQSLTLGIVRTYFDDAEVTPGFATDTEDTYGLMEWLQVGEHRIPVDQNASTLVPYRGRQGSFPYIPATDILHGKLKPGELAGRIVLVGTSAPGLMDLRVTPVETAYPGVEVHANLIAGILDGDIKMRPGYVLGLEALTTLLIGLLLSFLLPPMSPLRATLTIIATTGLIIAGNLYAWEVANLVLPLSGLLTLCFGIYVLDILYGFFVESHAKKQVTEMFGQYVPPEVVDSLSENPEIANMEGESREMTVLFSDVRDFTSISEKLPAKELSRLMNAYLTRMTEEIQKYHGTVDKYIGDAIMAFWGAPLPDADHPRNALLAAMAMQTSAAKLREEFQAMGWPPLKLGIGLNTGPMNVGNMGSAFRRAYTVMGDSVNLGARLESITKRYGAGILVSETTSAANPDIAFRKLDRIRVKGKHEPVEIFEPIALKSALDAAGQARIDGWNTAFARYLAQDWDALETQLATLAGQGEYPALIALYRERIDIFKAQPPGADWDGVFVYETK